ncbi:TRAM domain-containing protein [Candidatus Woesearchaeota archaeon]|nr:TRAM domain-containing protein [Candidatus Woesearchaeota archaeon]
MRHDRGRGGFRPRNFAPVKVGDELDVKIEAVGEKGDGIAKKDGFVLFVPGTKQGDEVKIRVTRVLQKVGFAEVAGEKSAGSSEESSDSEESHEESYEEPSAEGGSESEEDYSGQDTENFGEEDNQ